MAITFDAIAKSTASATSPLTWSHTCGASASVLVVGVVVEAVTGTEAVSGVTYNSVAMTQIGTAQNGMSINVTLWYLYGPTVGANTVSVTHNSIFNVLGFSTSLSGTVITGGIDSFAQQGNISSASASTSTITVADDAWIVDILGLSATGTLTLTPGGSQTNSQTTIDSNAAGGSSTQGPITPAGSTAMTWSLGGSGPNYCQIVVSFAPNPPLLVSIQNPITQGVHIV